MDMILGNLGAYIIGAVGLVTLIGLLMITKAARRGNIRACRICGGGLRDIVDGQRCPQCSNVVDPTTVLTPSGALSKQAMTAIGLVLAVPGAIALMGLILVRLTF